MVTDPLLSVIVPIYNVEEYLSQCVESILNQSYRNLEVILVNDGSPDDCPRICDEYAGKDERIKVIHQENAGLVRARKVGLVASSGEFIACVDGDDWIEENTYEVLMMVALKHGVDIVAAGHKEELLGEIVEECLNSIPVGYYGSSRMKEEVYPKMLCSGPFSDFGVYSYLWSKIFKKKVLFDAQMKVSDSVFMAEDAACLYPALLSARSIFISDVKGYRYRQRINSMVKSRVVDQIELLRYNELYEHLHHNFKSSPPSWKLVEQLNAFILSLLTVRSEMRGDNDDIEEFTAFEDVPHGSRVALCGAGTFGQYLHGVLQISANYQLVCWVDDWEGLYSKAGFDVAGMEGLNNRDIDVIVVAYVNELVANRMKLRLEKMGFDETQIRLVSHFRNNPVADCLSRYGIAPIL